MSKRFALLGVICFAAFALSGCQGGLDFSPDGKKMAISTGAGVVTVNTDGTNRHLIPGGQKGTDPSWSPDGQYILFSRGGDKGNELYLHDVKASKSRKVAVGLQAPYAWREDSRRFVALGTGQRDYALAVWCDVPSGKIVQKVTLPVNSVMTGFDHRMIWLQGTDDIAFMALEKPNLFLVESGKVKQVTTTGDITGIGKSLDGSALLWARSEPPKNTKRLTIYRYDLTTRVPLRIASIVTASLPSVRSGYHITGAGLVMFSHDGGKVAFSAEFENNAGSKSGKPKDYGACYTANVDGSNMKLVRRTQAAEHGEGVEFAVWSPDGRLGLLEYTKGGGSIYVYTKSLSDSARVFHEKNGAL
jgi:Tol biopolymer transport system component